MKPILKCSSGAAKVDRVANLITIIGAMKKEPMSLVDISNAIDYSKSGGRKYIAELKQANVIQFHSYASGGAGKACDKPLYTLNGNAEFVAAYIETIKLIGLPKQKFIGASKPNYNRNLHLVQDDSVFRVKLASFKTPEHSDLMQAFYGMAKS